MARPIAFDREAAIDVAMNEIWRNGYEATSVKALSQKLGITRSSFYNAFRSREALFQLALDRYLSQAPEGAFMAMTPETPLKPALTEILRAVCKQRSRDPDKRGCMAVNCITELLPTDGQAGNIISEMATALLAQLEQLVEWAKVRSELPEETDVQGMALAIHSLMMGINTQSKILGNEKDLWRSASTSLIALNLYSPSEQKRDYERS